MKRVTIEKYECDWCKDLFDTARQALDHEKYHHKCPNCEHVWYLYGSEMTCSEKTCRFKPKDDTKERK